MTTATTATIDFINGEGYLAMHHPIYKRRYAVSCDLVLGCRIGCEFCYYKFGPTAPYFQRGVAHLKPLASGEAFAHIVLESKMIRPSDVVIVSARSDMSMPEHKAEFIKFLDVYPHNEKPLKLLMLQRGVYSARDWERFGAFPVYFGTTITPEAAMRGFNTVRDDAQIRGLIALRDAGAPPERISLELGPILPDTVDTAIAIAHELARLGLIAFATYRGASVGRYGDFASEIERLRARGFFDMPVAYTYHDGYKEKEHEYYLLKNHIPEAVERAFLAGVADLPLRFYRHTGHMYAREWGVKVAGNRNNRPRKDMQQYVRDMTLDQFSAVLRDTFEIEPRVEKIAPATFVLHRRGTEDVAHAIGSETQTNVLFTDFDNQPSLADLAWYKEEGWLSRLRMPA